MNFLIVNNFHIQEFTGGVGIYVHRYINELINSGHDVSLLVLTKNKNLPEYEIIDNVKVHRTFTKKGNLGPLRFSNRKLLTEKACELLAKNHYDVLNIHSACYLDPEFLRTSRKKYGYKLLYTLHAVHAYEILFDFKKAFDPFNLGKILLFSPKFIMQYLFEFSCLKQADKVVIMSEYVKSTIKTFFGEKYLNKVLVSAIGVSKLSDLDMVSKKEARKKLGIEGNKKVFITVRRLVPRMGLFNLIKAFKKLEDNSAYLYIIGKGELYNPLGDYIKKLNLTNRVKLAGFVENSLLHYYYCAADCFILPTEELEGFGIATIEALSYNLPVIGTPNGATPEILNKFDSDLITHDYKPASLLDKMDFFIQNQQRYRDINFKDKVYKEYNWSGIINEIVEVIK